MRFDRRDHRLAPGWAWLGTAAVPRWHPEADKLELRKLVATAGTCRLVILVLAGCKRLKLVAVARSRGLRAPRLTDPVRDRHLCALGTERGKRQH